MAAKIVPAPLTRPLCAIAREINLDYRTKGKAVHFSAKPYVEALHYLDSFADRYYEDSAEDVVIRLLSNLSTWRGETATRVKAELRATLAHHQAQKAGR